VRLTRAPQRRPPPRLLEQEWPIVPPPATLTVYDDRGAVLFAPDGTPLVRAIGF
jgi:hypothetical protein